ncbi:type II toxin-antitoxin system Phd/YefM family antitoxin [Paracoccus aminophilus]|uniref:Antitoxin n=1 Tax=Paracoccus aminophilus JCM 7686 TaxID=1367847 RepID=S5Y0N4_PARAH|nr:type II toxin-antitoxin system prevent-host-death family antitoxin [Paracoccus aminophilus]AGT11052.1 antitoxin of toxin-antitoxin system [Paracoccus aminophilus JCM 7686]
MKTVNMHEAKTNLSKLVEAAAKGESFVIARAGKPLVKVTMLEGESPRRLGFLAGQYSIPDDFDRLGEEEIQGLFDGAEDEASGAEVMRRV